MLLLLKNTAQSHPTLMTPNRVLYLPHAMTVLFPSSIFPQFSADWSLLYIRKYSYYKSEAVEKDQAPSKLLPSLMWSLDAKSRLQKSIETEPGEQLIKYPSFVCLSFHNRQVVKTRTLASIQYLISCFYLQQCQACTCAEACSHRCNILSPYMKTTSIKSTALTQENMRRAFTLESESEGTYWGFSFFVRAI